jgi:hypothetical protein
MAEWTDEHGIRRGVAADAGALCITKDSPQGVDAATYRRMCSQLGAPRPIQAIDPATKQPYELRNPRTGEKEYDLNAVEEWNRTRPGPGAWHHDITRRTPMRHQVLAEIDAGRFTVTIEGLTVKIHRDGELWEGRANTRVFTDLQRGEMVAVPPVGGAVTITEKARPVLERWNADEPAVAERAAKVALAGA